MTADATVAYPAADAQERRTLILGTRLFLAANTMLMLAMLFAYLYLRSQNLNGMWRPAGIIGDLPPLGMTITLLLQAAALGAVVAAIGGAARGRSVRGVVALALILALASGIVRVWYQYNLGPGWGTHPSDSAGNYLYYTYTAVSEMWLAIIIVEVLLGCLWLVSLVTPGPRATSAPATERHLRAFSEFWAYTLVVSTLVWLLIRLV